MSRKLAHNKEKARKAGLALTVKDYVALIPQTEEADNAAGPYRRAIEILKLKKTVISALTNGTRDGQLKTSPTAIALSDDETRANLNKLQSMFDSVSDGAKKAHLNWNRDWAKGAALLLPEMAEMKQIVKLLCVRAKFRVQHGNVAGAILDFGDAAAICRQLEEEPMLIASLVQIACEAILLQGISDSIGLHPFDERLLNGSRAVLTKLPQPTDFGRVLQGEMLFQSTSMETLTKGDLKSIGTMFGANDGGGEDAKLVKLFAVPAIRDATYAYMLEKDIEIVESARRNRNDPHAWSVQMGDVERQMDAEKTVVAKLAAIFLPVFTQAGDASAKNIAQRRAAVWMIDSLLAARANGVSTLGGVRPTKAPDDPFTHQPMRFKPGAKLLIAYSVGADGRDDGGDIFNLSSTPRDVGFAVGDKPKKRVAPVVAPAAPPAVKVM